MLNFPKVEKSYRPELNGLRALAVLLVLFFHLDFHWMQGGFLGVDIFLVISGYFISKNLLYDLQNERFSFKKFYTKRLRRLFPALIVTIAGVLLAGYYLMTPAAYERLGLSSLFSSLSASNFFFWKEAGYFDGEAATKPLLHMWSLSLEEQFYLFWPLCLMLVFRWWRKGLGLLLLVGIVASIAICEAFRPEHASAVFFLIPFRMFEFWMGALCIGLEHKALFKKRGLQEILFAMGLVLMIGTSIYTNGDSRMPGLLSLVPCAGAMMVILGGKAPWARWTLSNKTMEYIGKASYSIYLVHWPLIVYFKYYTLEELSKANQWVLGLISIALGFLMWQFVENKFRYTKKPKIGMDRIWIGVPVLILLLVLTGSFIWKSGGIPGRFSDQLYMTKEEITSNRDRYFEKYSIDNELLLGDPGSGQVIIMGNSHAIDLIYMLRENGFTPRITRLNSLGKCYNFGQSYAENDEGLCLKQLEHNLADENWATADAIFLHDNWPQLNLEGLKEILKKVRALTEAPIYVVGPKMTYTQDIPDIVHASKTVVPKNINSFAQQFEKCNEKVFIDLKLIEEFSNPKYANDHIFYIDLLELQGGDNLEAFEIVSSEKLKFLYFDFNHFTTEGARKLGTKLKKVHPELFNANRP
ncbi:MAG TPA: acyltransferase family protein [Flavobacteriaceae bacterium]|nr:acyltransferase [Flavobacteriaceae bacterium]MCB9212493.1 acyltransferase [Alteromonas sp.]HPF10556.1 acyltransferase family protein [Flavobacteriaceae bacterium]HQU20244.1 acyltransferase family protein [Flavobacteriaceae bacterium]HQU66014.1 acyltransferase family protein [Flavobacteriaceae bacterium]